MARQFFVSWIAALALALMASSSSAVTEQAPIDLNTASVTQLNELSGIGGSKAQAIVDYREKNGPFETVDDLLNVKGIGDKLLAKLRPQLTVSNSAGKAPAPKSVKQ